MSASVHERAWAADLPFPAAGTLALLRKDFRRGERIVVYTRGLA